MSKSWNRTETWLALVVVPLGLIPAVILGLWGYMRATATPIHPDPQDVPSVTHSTPLPDWAEAVAQGRQIVRAGLSEQNLPGLSVAVGVDGRLVWAEGFGWADLENRVPVGPDTRFRIGTASTALTSAAVGVLLEQGRLKLDEEVQTYVPGFPRKPWPLTLGQVMGHVAGVRNDGGDEGPLLSAHCEQTIDGIEAFAEYPLLFEPGTRFRPSSYGWILVSAAVEAAAGAPFLGFMRAHVFEPLGLHDTKADSATEPIPNRATPYFPRFAADPRYGLHLMRPVDYSCYAGASAFLSTPSDLVRFGMAIERGTLLQAATVALLQTPQRLASGQETAYGLGWDLDTVTLSGAPARAVGHHGTSLGGRVATLMTFPDHGLTVAVTSNTSYADTASLAVSVAQAFAGGRREVARPPTAGSTTSKDRRRAEQEDPGMLVWWATEVECASAIVRLERDAALDEAALREAFHRLAQLATGWHEVDPSDAIRETAVRILRVHPVRAADALQLAAAFIAAERRPSSLEIVTLDDRLAAAARKEGFPVTAS